MTSKAKTSKQALTEIAPANVRHVKNLIQDARKDHHAQHARHVKQAAASGTDKDVLHKQVNKQPINPKAPRRHKSPGSYKKVKRNIVIKKPGQLAGFLAFNGAPPVPA